MPHSAHPFRQTLAPQPSRGFTVVELCVTLALAAIVLAIGIPSMRSFSATNRMATEVNELLTQLRLARSEALQRAEGIALCPSDNGTDCIEDPQWHRGWIVFVDPNANREHDAGEELLRVQSALRGGITITSSPFRNRLRFQPNGMSLGSNATLEVCSDALGSTPRVIVLSNTGRTRVLRTQPDGSEIDCS